MVGENEEEKEKEVETRDSNQITSFPEYTTLRE